MIDSTQNVLFIVTSNDQLGDTGKPTGFHWEELATPYYTLEDNGYGVEFASPKGGLPPHDPGSLKDDDSERPESVRRFLADDTAMNKLKHSQLLDQLDLSGYAGLYIPGGHGTMWDLPNNEDLGRLIQEADSMNKVIGSVCHGPAAFVGVLSGDGEPFVNGREINSFTDEEEQAVGLDETVPFLLESKLRDLGGRFTKSGKFEPCVVVDGNLVTGQNPPSVAGVADKMVALLQSAR